MILSGCFPPSNLVLAPLIRKYNPIAILQPIRGLVPAKPGKWKRIARKPFQYVQRVFNAQFLARALHPLYAEINALAAHETYEGVTCNIVKVSWEDINSEATKQVLRDLTPEILVVNGAPIISEELFNIPTIVSLNVHYGICPDYRGEHTVFWPMLEGKFDKIGATIHKIEKKVDSGAVYVEAYPDMRADDSEGTLYVKSSTMIGQALVEFVDEIVKQGKLPKGGKPRDSKDEGKLVYYRSRMPYQHCKYWLLRKLGMRNFPTTPARVQKYYETV